MDKNKEELRKIPRIVNDDIALRLWSRYVTVEEEKDLSKMEALYMEIHRKPFTSGVKNPILKRMVEDGAGFDGLNAAMMTYGYLRDICLYFINQAK